MNVMRKKELSPEDISIIKYVHPSSKDKWYTPVVGNMRQLRLSFRTHTVAFQYGQAVLVRYGRKYRLMMEAKNGNRTDS